MQQPLLDLAGVDLDRARTVTYLLHQCFRYDYDGPAFDVRERLVALPRAAHGNLRRRTHRLDVTLPGESPDAARAARRTCRANRMGNLVVNVRLPVVRAAVEFTVAALVERDGPLVDAALPSVALRDPRHLLPTRLTRPDAALQAVAAELRASTSDDVAFADAACTRIRGGIEFDVDGTTVLTTAAQAWRGGRGVCQDAAHALLAVCRAARVPARYVSGHLLGQPGGSHAWVEVLVADRAGARAIGVDPSNGCHVGARHLPVAVGRDYVDVAPTSGFFSGTARGELTCTKHAGVTAVEPA